MWWIVLNILYGWLSSFINAEITRFPCIPCLNIAGMFPNHIPNPEDKSAMAAITKAVHEHKADLGIIFDTDVDR